jgi:16S rRNA G966 N2-methylase RsmD
MSDSASPEATVEIETIRRVATAALRNFVGDALVERSDIKVTISNGDDGTRHIVIQVRTSDRPKFLAQYVPFTEDSLSGFALPYLRGWLAAEFDWQNDTRVHLDVCEDERVEMRRALYQVISRDQDAARWREVISPQLDDALRDAGLSLALVAGEIVGGPSLGMIEVVTGVLTGEREWHVFDGYSGSAGAAQVALRKGATTVRSVDIRAWTSVTDLLGEDERWSFVRDDALAVLAQSAGESWNLIVLDPFYGDTLAVARQLRELSPTVPVVFNGGPAYLRGWQDQIASALREACSHYDEADINDERIYILNP